MTNCKICCKKHFFNFRVGFNILYDILAICIFGILNIVFLFIKPYNMDIPLERENPNVIYPKKDSTVPESILFPLAFLTPAIVIIVAGLIRKSPKFIVFGLLSLTLAGFINGTITNLGKIFAGRPRPNFYARIDANKDDLDAWKSFPSGHSSISFVGLVYTSLILAGQFKIFNKGHQSWKVLLVIIPWLAAGAVAVSRTRDYYHNFGDILAGTFIGIFVAFLVYFSKFNPLSDEHSEMMKIENAEEEEEYKDTYDKIVDKKEEYVEVVVEQHDDEQIIQNNEEIPA